MTSNETILKAMLTRYAVKAFDPGKAVTPKDINTILDAMRYAPSSFGLQPWKFFVIQSQEIKRQFGDAVPINRPKFEDASHVILLARLNSVSQDYIDNYFELVKRMRNQTDDDIKLFYDMVSKKASSMPNEALNTWTSRQVYIALGAAILSAALLGVDTCPMEGIAPAAFDKLIGIEGTEYTSTVALALGYRSDDDPFAKFPRVRFAKEQVITTL